MEALHPETIIWLISGTCFTIAVIIGLTIPEDQEATGYKD